MENNTLAVLLAAVAVDVAGRVGPDSRPHLVTWISSISRGRRTKAQTMQTAVGVHYVNRIVAVVGMREDNPGPIGRPVRGYVEPWKAGQPRLTAPVGIHPVNVNAVPVADLI